MKRLTALSLLLVMLCSAFMVGTAAPAAEPEITDPKQLGEVLELREKNSETYRLEDGSYECVIFAEDKYFEDETGELVEISNTVVPEKHTIAGKEYGFTSDGSVYASQEEQDYIYSCSQMELSNVRSLLERYGIRLLKESITPVYTLDMLAFAANDVFEILPLEYSSESDCRQVYMAKTVFENNGFAGNIGFFIKDGVAQLLYLNPSNIIEEYKDNDMFQASCSYADHASRIAALLGSNVIIPPENVRYVHLKGYKHGLGDCFYVCVGGDGYFIPVGSISTEYVPVAVDHAITISELKAIALEDEEKYNEHTISMEEWRKAHPGESWHPVGSGSEVVVTIISSSSVDNIIAVNNFFSERCSSVNDKENSYHLISNDANEGSLQSDTQKVKKTAVLLYFAIPSTALMLIALSILIFLKRRNRKDILP